MEVPNTLKKKEIKDSTRELDYSIPWKSKTTNSQAPGQQADTGQVNALFTRPELGTGRNYSRQ